jgi:hypothetical protein
MVPSELLRQTDQVGQAIDLDVAWSHRHEPEDLAAARKKLPRYPLPVVWLARLAVD